MWFDSGREGTKPSEDDCGGHNRDERQTSCRPQPSIPVGVVAVADVRSSSVPVIALARALGAHLTRNRFSESVLELRVVLCPDERFCRLWSDLAGIRLTALALLFLGTSSS